MTRSTPLLLPLVALLAACEGGHSAGPPTIAPAAAAPTPTVRAGTLAKIGDSIWTVTPADEPTTRYCVTGPLATPALLVDQAKVWFSGAPGATSPNARLACTPFELTSLSADRSKPPASGCPATYEDASRSLVCPPSTSPTRSFPSCEYPEGLCRCVLGCQGGAPVPPEKLPTYTVCLPRACDTATAGKPCSVEGTRCGGCEGSVLDCKQGTWVPWVIPPAP